MATLEQAAGSELGRFAGGIIRDIDPVRGAILTRCTTSQVEGQISTVKAIKAPNVLEADTDVDSLQEHHVIRRCTIFKEAYGRLLVAVALDSVWALHL